MFCKARKATFPDTWVWCKRFQAMSCYEEFYDMVCAGVHSRDVAEWLRDVKRECLDVQKDSLVRMISKFRSEIPDSELSKALPSVNSQAVVKMAKGLQSLDELERLYEVQTERIAIGLKNERAAQKLNAKMTQEIGAARELVLSYHKVQAELGLVSKHLGKLTIESTQDKRVLIAQQYGPKAGELKTKSMNNVLGIFNRVLALSEQSAEEDDEGGAAVVMEVEVEDDEPMGA